ncbi:hypothetical protein WR25_14374 [Diploscapter pachys]|uniref:Uncharacterized protein n=1 Tax=Diploscapter pachys TaxID=2018661 RepID=A0A2A2KQA1_9BILA|nr:hypothetical protein WR25_14374 [Diploscapter pachys]
MLRMKNENFSFERFNAKIIKPILMRNEKRQTFDATRIIRAYEKITLEDAMSMATSKESIRHKAVARIRSVEVPIQAAMNNDLTLTPADRQFGKVPNSWRRKMGYLFMGGA